MKDAFLFQSAPPRGRQSAANGVLLHHVAAGPSRKTSWSLRRNGKCRRGEKGCLESVVNAVGGRGFEPPSFRRRISLTNEFRGGKAETPPRQRDGSWVMSLGPCPFGRRFRISCKSAAFHVFSLLPNPARRMLVWTSCGFRVDRSSVFGVCAANHGRRTT